MTRESRTRAWLVLAGVALVLGLLAYRVLALEARVERLAREAPGTVTARHGGEPVAASARPGSGEAMAVVEDDAPERRIAAVEADVAGLRERVSALSHEAQAKADRADLDRSASADRILGLVTQEAMRVRDRQVEFHRERWIEMRSRAVEEFAARHGLTAQQESEIQRLLVAEVDEMVAIFKAHGADEDPEEANEEWIEMLQETDRKVKRILDPAQAAAFDQGRAYERRVFMPWLPQ